MINDTTMNETQDESIIDFYPLRDKSCNSHTDASDNCVSDCQTITNKTMLKEKNKYCPVCKGVMKLDSITVDGYKLYRCKGCGRFGELIPMYINYFKSQAVSR